MIENCSNSLSMLAFDQRKDEANLFVAKRFTEEKLQRQITLELFSLTNAREIFELIDRNRDHLSQHGETTAIKYPTYESVVESITNPKQPCKQRYAIRNGLGQLVGSINLNPNDNNPKRGKIGYYLGKEFQGHGYMTQAVEALTEIAFGELGYDTLFGDAREDNFASANVFIRAGYQETGLVDDDVDKNYLDIEFTMDKTDITIPSSFLSPHSEPTASNSSQTPQSERGPIADLQV